MAEDMGARDRMDKIAHAVNARRDWLNAPTAYGLLAVAEAVLDLADAVRAHRGPVKGSTRPVPPAKPTGITPCAVCGHVRDMHHDDGGEGYKECRASSCLCTYYVPVVVVVDHG